MTKSLEDIQVELEIKQVDDGIKRYEKAMNKAQETHSESSLPPQRKLLHTAIMYLSKGIREKQDSLKQIGGVKPLALKTCDVIDVVNISLIVCT